MNTGGLYNYDVEKIRKDFPIFEQEVYGKPLTFLDSAASSQKPRAVIDEVANCYASEYANIHRGGYICHKRLRQSMKLRVKP